MSIDLVTPWAALVGIVVVVPVAAFVVAGRRAASVRRAVDLTSPARRGAALSLAALVLSVALLALAAAQPVVASSHRSTVRRDADVFLVIDTSRSMLASAAAGAPTRFARAVAIARSLREATPTAAVGIASMTDRVLPNLFPTEDRADFDVTLRDAIGVQRPPPAENAGGSGTDLGALADLAAARFFVPEARTRIAVVLTDGESRPFAVERVGAMLRRASIRPVLIRLGAAGERVWRAGGKSESYRPRNGAGVELARVAALLGGSAYGETEAKAAITEVVGAIGGGTVRRRQESTSIRALAPFLVFASLLPIAFLLWKRNLG